MNNYDIVASAFQDDGKISYIVRKNEIDEIAFTTLEEAEEYITQQENP